ERAVALSVAAARDGSAVDFAGAVQIDAERGLVCDGEFLAGGGRSGRPTLLCNRGSLAVRRAERSDCSGSRKCAERGRPQRVRGIPGAAGGFGVETRLWATDSKQDGPRSVV